MAKKPEIVSASRRNSYHGTETAGEDFDYNDVLTIDAAGTIREATNSDYHILGLAQAEASGVAGTAVVVDEVFEGDEVLVDTYNSSAAAVCAASNFIPGDKYALYTAGGNWYADFLNTTGITNALVFIRSYGDLRDELTDQVIYRGLFRIADAIPVNTTGN